MNTFTANLDAPQQQFQRPDRSDDPMEAPAAQQEEMYGYEGMRFRSFPSTTPRETGTVTQD